MGESITSTYMKFYIKLGSINLLHTNHLIRIKINVFNKFLCLLIVISSSFSFRLIDLTIFVLSIFLYFLWICLLFFFQSFFVVQEKCSGHKKLESSVLSQKSFFWYYSVFYRSGIIWEIFFNSKILSSESYLFCLADQTL